VNTTSSASVSKESSAYVSPSVPGSSNAGAASPRSSSESDSVATIRAGTVAGGKDVRGVDPPSSGRRGDANRRHEHQPAGRTADENADRGRDVCDQRGGRRDEPGVGFDRQAREVLRGSGRQPAAVRAEVNAGDRDDAPGGDRREDPGLSARTPARTAARAGPGGRRWIAAFAGSFDAVAPASSNLPVGPSRGSLG
jgi:hypothetical protein